MTTRLSIDIEPKTVVAFNGKIRNGLRIHDERKTYLFSFGQKIGIKHLDDHDKCALLHGHTNEISCMQISHNQKYISTGQKTYMGFKPNVAYTLSPRPPEGARVQDSFIVTSYDVTHVFSHRNRPKMAAVIISENMTPNATPELPRVVSERVYCAPTFGTPHIYCQYTNNTVHTSTQTSVIIWELDNENIYGSHELHKANVESVAFTSNDRYLISLGGDHFEKGVLVFSLELQEVLCGCQASQGIEGIAHCLESANITPNMFVSAGERTIRVWQLDEDKRQVTSDCVPTGHLKRDIRFITIDKDDLYCYCGTTSGDILKIRLDLVNHKNPGWVAIYVCDLTRLLSRQCQSIDAYYSSGVTAIALTPQDEIILGTGNGMIHITEQVITRKIDKNNKNVREIKLRGKKELKFKGAITSVIFHHSSNEIYIGTDDGIISKINYSTLNVQILMTAHKYSVSDVAFPSSSSKVFVTSSNDELRIWGVDPIKDDKIVELRKISVPGVACSSIHCMANGSSIISGWSDGKIRIFGPESGKLLYCIADSHRSSKVVNDENSNEGVTALTGTSDSKLIISGGGDGQVRVWKASPVKQDLVATMKEHKGSVCCIRMHSNDEECVSASVDGTCIIWDLNRFSRKQVVFASTIFRTVSYGLEECQLLTGGSDNNISYWEVHNGALIRQVTAGARTESIQSIDLLSHGDRIVTGSTDGVLRVWLYHKGALELTGKGHGAMINKVKVAPDNQTILSVGKDGSIMRWKLPS